MYFRAAIPETALIEIGLSFLGKRMTQRMDVLVLPTLNVRLILCKNGDGCTVVALVDGRITEVADEAS